MGLTEAEVVAELRALPLKTYAAPDEAASVVYTFNALQRQLGLPEEQVPLPAPTHPPASTLAVEVASFERNPLFRSQSGPGREDRKRRAQLDRDRLQLLGREGLDLRTPRQSTA
jgi:hypothetical protein